MTRSKQKVFKIYSGITVDEITVRGVQVMRRRSDHWMNATQILKAAGLEKARRTRILEGEVQHCEHNKVQGGCGKYQGTWVPYEVGVRIASKYGIEEEIRPILNRAGGSSGGSGLANRTGANLVRFDKMFSSGSATAPSAHSARQRPPASIPNTYANASRSIPRSSFAPRKRRLDSDDDDDEADNLSEENVEGEDDEDDEVEQDDDEGEEVEIDSSAEESDEGRTEDGSPQPRHGVRNHDSSSRPLTPARVRYTCSEARMPSEGLMARVARVHRGTRLTKGRREWARELLEHFYGENNERIPRLLAQPPHGFDPDAPVDADGHTPLHWAAALGRKHVVRHIARSNVADLSARDHRGQTALMRSVSFANSYITHGFPEILATLQETAPLMDRDDRNIFHLIADTAPDSPMAPAARYYMEHVRRLIRAADPRWYAGTVNAADSRGETPLMLAARNRNQQLTAQLLEIGGDASMLHSRVLRAWESSRHDDDHQRQSQETHFRHRQQQQHHQNLPHRHRPYHHHPAAHHSHADRATSRTALLRRQYPTYTSAAALTSHATDARHAATAARDAVAEAIKPLATLVSERFSRLERQLADFHGSTGNSLCPTTQHGGARPPTADMSLEHNDVAPLAGHQLLEVHKLVDEALQADVPVCASTTQQMDAQDITSLTHKADVHAIAGGGQSL